MEQRRQFQRIHFLQRVIADLNGQEYETHCLDISLRGILLARPAQSHWALGVMLHVTLVLSAEEKIIMPCKLVHLDNDIAGCSCDSMDIDSLTSLRRLLELNLANPQEMQRELSELLRY
ncbi:MAG: hypothetical protein RL217_409 [Pseudomonadota bacterium]|jgi:hypothetical protein